MPLQGSFGSGGSRTNTGQRRQLGDSGTFSTGVNKLSLDQGGPTGSEALDITGQILQGTAPVEGLPDGSGINDMIDAISPGAADNSPFLDPPAPVDNNTSGGWTPITISRNENYNPGQTGVYEWTPRGGTNNNVAPSAPAQDFGKAISLNEALANEFGYGGDFGGGQFGEWRQGQSSLLQDAITDFINEYNGTPAPAAAPPPAPPSINDYNTLNFASTFAGGNNPHAQIQNAFNSGTELDQATRDYILRSGVMNDAAQWDVTGSNPQNYADTVNPILQQIMYQQALQDYQNQYGGQ